MQHKTIIATCAAMAAFSGMATADIQLPLDVLNANNGGKTFSAQLGAGYATKYISRGLAFQNSASDHVIPLEAVGAYQLNNQYSLIGGLKYQWLTDNGLEHNDSGICDEGSAILGVSRKFGIQATTPASLLSATTGRKNTASFWTFTMTSAKGWKTSSGTAAYNIRSAG